jgi:hypothetical protein
MWLTKEEIQSFKLLYQKHFWVELSDQEALNWAIQLITLLRVIKN